MLFFKTHKGHWWLNFLFSFFAAAVIAGALFKIRHWPYADEMITIGLLCEVMVFLIMAFVVPPQPEYYWERIFPGLNVHPDEEIALTGKYQATPLNAGAGSNSALQKLDDMLMDADITPASLGKLSEGFKKFGTTVENISDITEVVAATNDYSQKTREASVALETMKEAYTNAAGSVQNFNTAAEGTKLFHEQVQSLTKNLSSLNTIYELELQDTNNHLKAMNQFYSNLTQASQVMQGSVEDAKKAHEQISLLSNNLSKLNQVYGNMISAMQGR